MKIRAPQPVFCLLFRLLDGGRDTRLLYSAVVTVQLSVSRQRAAHDTHSAHQQRTSDRHGGATNSKLTPRHLPCASALCTFPNTLPWSTYLSTSNWLGPICRVKQGGHGPTKLNDDAKGKPFSAGRCCYRYRICEGARTTAKTVSVYEVQKLHAYCRSEGLFGSVVRYAMRLQHVISRAEEQGAGVVVTRKTPWRRKKKAENSPQRTLPAPRPPASSMCRSKLP